MSEEGTKDRPGNNHYLFNLIKKYSTGWVACSDWTDQQLGTALGGDVVHGLSANLEDLIVKVLISSDGTEGNAFTPMLINRDNGSGDITGISQFYVDANNITIQTGTDGIKYILSGGGVGTLNTQSWYYKIVVYKITCKEYYSE